MKFGPSFGDELIAVNLQNGVAWNAETGVVWFNDDVPQSQRDAVMVVVAAHDPTKPLIDVPRTVTRYQAEVYMRRIGLWDRADALFVALPDDDERKIAWLRAPTFNRQSPALIYAAQQLGITEEQLDTMFVEASEIV